MSCGESCCGGSNAESVLKGTVFELPKQLTVTDYFRNCLVRSVIEGESPAILGENRKTVYTFNQLNSLSTKLGKALRQCLGFWTTNNLDGDLVIAFCLPVSEIIPAVILSILKLGATFLAIPISYYDQEIVKIVEVTKPMLVITESAGQTCSKFDCVQHLLTLVGVEFLWDLANDDCFDDGNEVVPLETLTKLSRRMASIVYTAGTKDEPQAVRIGHSEIINRCLWQYKAFPYVNREIASLSSSIGDVDCIAEILGPILAGIPLILISRDVFFNPKRLITYIYDQQISRITLAPLVLADLLNSLESLSPEDIQNKPLASVKYWIVSGDTLSLKLAERFFKLVTNFQSQAENESSSNPTCLIHLYGSTEVMSDVTYETFENFEHLESKSINGNASIGKPIGNTIIYVVDEDMNLVKTGTIGEICISGACVATGGYVVKNDEAIHSQKFCTNPYSKKKGYQSLYKTGDYGRIVGNNGDFHLFYEGRTEMIAKVKGKRVDLRDINEAVNNTKLVEECSVFCYHPNQADQDLIASCKYLPGVTQEVLEAALKKAIPDEHLVPRIFPIEEFRYLPSGRLNKHKLLRQYDGFKTQATPDDWEQISISTVQKEAAKILFSIVCKFTGNSMRYIIHHCESTIWSLGIHSLNALGVFLTIQEKGYVIQIEDFLKAKSLREIVERMTKYKLKSSIDTRHCIRSKLYEMAKEIFTIECLTEKHKEDAVGLLSKGYAAKNDVGISLPVSEEDYAIFLEHNWKFIAKGNLSLVASTNTLPAKMLGAVIVLDAQAKHKLPCDCPQPIKYIRELEGFSEKGPKEHIVWKKKGAIAQILMMGAQPESANAMENILLISILLEASIIRAKTMGYNGAMISSVCPLIRDLCQGILEYNLMKEVPIHQFRAKDKTKPFRLASNHHKLQVFYESF